MKNLKTISKMSKKERKAFYAQQRGSWYGISPVTRITPNKKAYDRNRTKRASRRDMNPDGSSFLTFQLLKGFFVAIVPTPILLCRFSPKPRKVHVVFQVGNLDLTRYGVLL